MGMHIELTELEAAINRYRTVHPAHGGVLSQPVSALATVYGWMIWNRVRSIDSDALPDSVRAAHARFYGCRVDQADP